MAATFELTPVAYVDGGRTEALDDHWGESRARLTLDQSRFVPEVLAGLREFSHVEVIFIFDRVSPTEIEYGARHPRGREDWPLVGIFAQRGKNRPNRIGLCICRVVRIDGLTIEVEGLDAIHGTPVLDIKPVMKAFLPRGKICEPAWVDELMRDYW